MQGSILLWLTFALMTGAAVFLVLAPLSRRRAQVSAASDVAVYRDQLAEIERDVASGLIGAPEAEAARVEVARRVLAAADRSSPEADAGNTNRRRLAAMAALVLVPLVAVVAYGLKGQPGYAGQPLAARVREAPPAGDIAALVARIEAHLNARPDDGRGWEVLAPVYLRLGRLPDAVRARANALRLLGATADREADLAEAQIAASGGVVTAEAKAGLDRALALSAGHAKATYFLGLAAAQDGRTDEARAIWTRLVEGAPANAPWIPAVRAEIARLGGGPVPDAADIRRMVEGLAARLAADGSDFDGWLRLVRSYTVLGEGDKARAAAADARRRFAAEADKIGRLDDLMRELGIGG